MDRPNLILRPTVIGGARLKDDFAVLFEGAAWVGSGLPPGALARTRWEWVEDDDQADDD
jgi:hypothetical protein